MSVESLILAVEMLICVPAFYLGFMSLSALVFRAVRGAGRERGDSAAGTIAFVIPAHNEALVIERTISNLKGMADNDFTVNVVADNCSDQTASICRDAGARVYERFSENDKSKGHALAWLIPRVIADHRDSGTRLLAVVVVDADGTISPNSASAARRYFARGAEVLQSAYRLERGKTSRSRIMAVAFAAINVVRGYGRFAFGFPDTLKGNGMWFRADIPERFPWRAFSLAEDLEFGLMLRGAGVHISFFPESTATGLPGEGHEASSHQRARWESGRLAIVMKELPRLIKSSLSPRSFDLMMELATPPLSFYVVTLCGFLVMNQVLGLPQIFAAGAVTALGLNLVAAIPLAGLPADSTMDLAGAPFFLAWKLSLLPRIWRDRKSRKWIRTDRGQ